MAKPQRNRKDRGPKERPEFDQAILDLARVTRVTKGGKHLSFRALVLIGDRKGRVGYGVEKGADVQIAVDKAVNQAKKNIIVVPFDKNTIPHRVEAKYKSGKVMVKPAPKGSGIIAGSAIRSVLELAGVPNASAKMLGKTNNKIINVKTTFKALESFKPKAVEDAKRRRDAVKQNVSKKIETVEVAPEKKADDTVKKTKKSAPKKVEQKEQKN
ncbi:MAG TPA: 30S ribosomal protein S5 [Candidatus Magasanikbacteria bacterium]|nr:MAG: 30S ribosomal protein S5 [Candidatus Magasanikbacteria bacterium RIFOXYC2_FULL_39_8]HAT03725.1 30S ribosomal protein S5 [Candidatus Magasanikbacteria bacterium]